MDSETRAAFAALDEKMTAGFAQADRYFELLHEAYLELRDRLDALTERVARLEHEVAQFRDHVTREISEIRLELRELRARSDQTDAQRREIAELTVRVDRLERRQQD